MKCDTLYNVTHENIVIQCTFVHVQCNIHDNMTLKYGQLHILIKKSNNNLNLLVNGRKLNGVMLQ